MEKEQSQRVTLWAKFPGIAHQISKSWWATLIGRERKGDAFCWAPLAQNYRGRRPLEGEMPGHRCE